MLRAWKSRLCKVHGNSDGGIEPCEHRCARPGLIMQQPPPNPWSQQVQHAFSATWARAGKGRTGRQKGVNCRPLQVTGGHWRTPLDAIDNVEQVNSYWSLGSPDSLRSGDGDTALVLARVGGDEAAIKATLDDVREAVTGDQGNVSREASQ